MVPRVGQRIGPYEILGRLGSGGMGLVFSAWDARLQRDVAIKLLREEYATPTMRSRFLQEARAASGLNHPNICTIFDIGEVSGDPFLVMELLKGETLRQRISQKGKLTAEDIHRIGLEVLDALAMAHARGVIHRDIKPANIILVNKPGGFQAKVLDFGLAKVELSDEESTRFDLTTIGTTVGTVSYMSPEQARGEIIDARSDLFSLGSVLYEAATGELPFQGATSALIFVELLGKVPPAIRQQNPAIPKDLDRFISRLLAKSRADRFQSATSALQALRQVSFRKPSLGGISLWGNKSAGKQGRPETPPAPPAPVPPPAAPDVSPANRTTDVPASRSNSADTMLRPARRTADPFAARAANSPAPPSPSPVLDRATAPGDDRSSVLPMPLPAQSAPPASLPPAPAPVPPQPPASPRAPGMGAMVLRPVKPDPVRPTPPRDGRSTGSSAEAPSGGGSPYREESPGAAAAGTAEAFGSGQTDAASRRITGFRGEQNGPQGAAEGQRLPTREPRTEAGEPKKAENAQPAVHDAAGGVSAAPGSGGSRKPWIAVAALVMLVVGACVWYFLFRRALVPTAEPTTVALGAMENGSGDSSLSGVMAVGLQFAALQSSHLSVRSGEDYTAGLRASGYTSGVISPEQARDAARAIGASVLASGDIHGEGAAYELTLHLDDVATGKRLSDFSETASSREQIPETLDRLASDMRSALGESSDSIGRSAVPLSKEATSNLDALEAFAAGAGFEAAGNSSDAMLSFQRAVGFEPRFTQSYLRLAGLYREQHAEVAAARAAAQAQTSAVSASARTQWLAQASYAIHVAGDYGRAIEPIQQLLALYPHDVQGLDVMALAQFLGGKFADAQATAERALRLSRFDPNAIGQDEAALLAQGRPEAVAGVEAQAQAAGVVHPDMAMLAAASGVPATAMLLPSPTQAISPATAATLLDAGGHFSEASERWQAVVGLARSTPESISAAAYANSVSALHRALAGDCTSSLALAQQGEALPSGPEATFSAGEARALCGDAEGARRSLALLNSAHGRASAAQGYMLPDLAATIAWKSGDAAGALRTLDAARQFDPMSLTAYLRGLVEISAKQPQLSIVQFQAILSHRGPTTLFQPEVYPLAQLGLGRAYAASGDNANSSVAYGRFLELWSMADAGIAAVTEARSHVHP